MTRNFGIASDRQRLGGQSTLPAASIGTLNTPSNSIPFAGRADSLRGDWPNSPGLDWESFIPGRSPFAQMMIDLAAVVSIVILSCVGAVGIAAAAFILFCVRL